VAQRGTLLVDDPKHGDEREAYETEPERTAGLGRGSLSRAACGRTNDGSEGFRRCFRTTISGNGVSIAATSLARLDADLFFVDVTPPTNAVIATRAIVIRDYRVSVHGADFGLAFILLHD
jgi:hypothetical protein